jgi:hypothetical protein
MREREEAYARNPDQPAVASTHGATTSALAGHVVQRQGTRRPVPMLLQRRVPAAVASAEAQVAPVVASVPPAQTLPAVVPAGDESSRTPDAVASSA